MTKPIALITGANRGIGFAVARALSMRDIKVLIAARNLAKAESAAAEIGHGAIGIALDVTNLDAIKAARQKIEAEFGALQILVNNAGIAIDQWVPALEVDTGRVRETFETNFVGALACCQAFLPGMINAGYGRVVNVSSELASMTNMQMGRTLAYRSSKAAMNAMTRILALECKDTPDLKINAACPGWVRTELGGPDAPRTVEEGADTIVWLATLPPDGASGGLFRDRAPYAW